MAKGKQIGHADMRGDKGIALIHRTVNDMGFVWNAIFLEAGIDGLIEIRDSVTAEVSNCIIQVQSKAGPSWFKSETDSTFEFLCDERDLEYWLRGNAPVILIVSRPDNDEAYWVSVKEYFREPNRRKTRKITFDKKANVFDSNCRDQLASLAIPVDSGLYLSALPRTETLVSNLVPVLQFPKRLFRASTKSRFDWQIRDVLRESPQDPGCEWLLHGGFLYSFHDVTFDPWAKMCLPGSAENLAANDWAFSDDRNKSRLFVQLLENCLTQLLYRQGVRYSAGKEHYCFRSTSDFVEKKVGGLSVFKGYESKTNPDRIAYYRHRAVKTHFLRFDQQWYLEITPSYHFTQDGYRLSRFFEERLSGIKQIERQNKVHLRQVKLWEEVLQQVHLAPVADNSRQRSLFSDEEDTAKKDAVEPYSRLTFGKLIEFEVDSGIPESAWLSHGGDNIDDADPHQLRLFE